MFAAPVEERSSNSLKGSAVKKLKEQIAKTLSVSAEDVELLLPGKAAVQLHKLANRALFYSDAEGVPLLLDLDGKGDLLPTVMGLWRSPNLLPRVWMPCQASRFLCRGADLMWPGTLLSRRDAEQGWAPQRKVAVLAHGNPAAVAVGFTATACPPRERAGVSVRVLQVYGDWLWKVVGRAQLPNPGFLKGQVQALEQAPEQEELQEEEEEEGETQEGETQEGQEGDDSAELRAKLASAEISSSAAEGEEKQAEEEEDRIPVEEMDRALQEALVLALKFRLPASELPIASDKLFGIMESMNRYPYKLNLSSSSFKKWKNFLKEIAKRNWVQMKKRGNDQAITSVSQDFPEFQSATLSKDLEKLLRKKENAQARAAELRQRAAALGCLAGLVPHKMEAVLRYRISSPSLQAGLFERFPRTQTWVKSEYQAVLADYIAEHGLAEGARRELVRMDELLAHSMFSSSTKNQAVSQADQLVGTTVPKAELTQRLHALFTKVAALVFEDEPLEPGMFKPELPQIKIEVSKVKRFFVTKVWNLEPFRMDAKDFSAFVRTKLSISAALTKTGTSKKLALDLYSLQLQGNHGAQIQDILVNTIGVPAPCVDLVLVGNLK